MNRLLEFVRRGYRGESFRVTLALYGALCAIIVPIGVVLDLYFGDNVACPFVAISIIAVALVGLVQDIRRTLK